MLRKHFRGYPELISFSSKYFYDASLQAIKIRTKPIDEVISFIELEHDGSLETIKNINTLEVSYIISLLENEVIKDNPMSVGVITPFRNQGIGEIKKRSEIYEKLKLKVMTFDSCQGEERDHIIYSFVENPHSKTSTNSVLGSNFERGVDPENNLRLQRLNVGMSRAKEKNDFCIKSKD